MPVKEQAPPLKDQTSNIILWELLLASQPFYFIVNFFLVLLPQSLLLSLSNWNVPFMIFIIFCHNNLKVIVSFFLKWRRRIAWKGNGEKRYNRSIFFFTPIFAVVKKLLTVLKLIGGYFIFYLFYFYCFL